MEFKILRLDYIQEYLFLLFYRDIQIDLVIIMVGWDILGDFCLVIKYEWVIERLDGKVIFLFFDMGCEQLLLLMKFFVFC